MRSIANGTFDVELTPGPSELEGAVDRFDFVKTFHGDLDGTGRGVMLSSGDPGSGEAGYVAIEVVTGRLGDGSGSFALQQLGAMSGGEQTLRYEIVPGSGSGDHRGITGLLRLTIEPDRTHRYELKYEV